MKIAELLYDIGNYDQALKVLLECRENCKLPQHTVDLYAMICKVDKFNERFALKVVTTEP